VTAFEQKVKTVNVNTKRQSKFVDPLDWKFFGMFGQETPLYRLHGKVPQHFRKQVYKDFCAAKSGFLMCTDVAARGLDLPAVNWILQYDPPCETSDYVHRVGRTARKGLAGQALTLLLPSETLYVSLLASHSLTLSAMSSQSMFLQTAKDIPGAKKFKNTDEMVGVILQRRAENVVGSSRPLSDAAAQAFRSYVRAYATHSADSKVRFFIAIFLE
jgi:ATP-dependent RNA helicase DDX31/DBP7